MQLSIKILLGLVPVALYLVALVILDSYKLVRLRSVVLAVAAGGVALLLCNVLNPFFLNLTGLTTPTFSRYLAPVVEETAKAAYLVFLVRTRRVGFMVDAVIFGFAIGAGFGILENIFYLRLIPDAYLYTWALRGCGTALMHGSTTAIFGLLAQRDVELQDSPSIARLVLPLGAAMILHSFYNHFFLSPVLTVVVLVVGVPLLTTRIYRSSEDALEKWLGGGFDADAEMLEIINRGQATDSRVGLYLASLGDRFPAEVVMDMFCLLKIQIELALEAKGILMLHKAGYEVEPDEELAEKLAEMAVLARNIGPTGRLALGPLRKSSHRDVWEAHLLSQ